MDDLSSALTILSAMITPAVLILASSSLILATSQRLSRALERTRKLYEQLESLDEVRPVGHLKERKLVLLKGQLSTISQRAKLLQYTLSTLFISLCIFVLTSVSIGIIAIVGMKYSWIPSSLGLVGICGLFYCSVLLIYESRIALRAVRQEMHYAQTVSEEAGI